ncbi:MAG: TadE/TadG family type IV pilus assembly protein [Acidimicrobiales bacterium]|nr:TadE/TadG family type IV pilus assembly protein [Acidimicrobiales bacterium]
MTGHTEDRGTTLIETAIVGLLVFFLFLAIFEFGTVFRDSLTTSDAVADAARIGAVVGPGVTAKGTNADFEVAKAVREGLSALNDEEIDRIVVFKGSGTSDSALSQVPVACRNGVSVPSICNSYDAAGALNAVEGGDETYFQCNMAGDPACGWDPATRQDGPTSADIETLGVYVRVQRGGVTGLFADTWTLDRATTLRLEPGVIEE